VRFAGTAVRYSITLPVSFNSLCEIRRSLRACFRLRTLPFNSLCEIPTSRRWARTWMTFSFNSLCEILKDRHIIRIVRLNTFNSLCEIRWVQAWATRFPTSLSILLVRFIILVTSILNAVIYTFNSLCEIPI